ncbi:heat shock protein transcriptional repressor HspR [Catelliglobosispora koreensis]|uniref:heat shock protein transcriptional repressor HspR n=1 Tax=Catelliglobosispora koreensis TaxID=129052 RepID=UPI000380CCCA|nr:helix-turn-helix transcriptional regulator [Catelliglobosispora koreensis]
MDSSAKVLLISVAAQLAGMHPQTLRQYDRMGLVEPGRSPGGGRRYSMRDVELLREIQRLSQEDGVNLAGVKRIIGLERVVVEMREQMAEMAEELALARQRLAELETISAFPRTDILPVHRTSTALMVWRPRSASDD